MPYHLPILNGAPEQEWPPGDPRNRMYLVEKHQIKGWVSGKGISLDTDWQSLFFLPKPGEE